MESCTPNYTTKPMALSWLHLIATTKLKPCPILIIMETECIGPDLMTAALKILEQVWLWKGRYHFIAVHIQYIPTYLGEVIALDGDEQNIYLEDPDPEDKWQKWKVNTKTGVILNRATKTPLSSFSSGAPCVVSDYSGHDCFQFINSKDSYTKFLLSLTV